MNKKATFSTKIDLSLKETLKKDLEKQNFVFSKPVHTIFSAKKKGIVCTLYSSGALVVQGKNKDEFIEFYLEPEILKNFEYSYSDLKVDMTPKIGVDESGKGDFFGFLCIAAVYADTSTIKKLLDLGVKDSKKISDSSILKLSKKIKKLVDFSLVSISPKKYNELYQKFKNLNNLLAWAHATAIYDLNKKTNCKNILIDRFTKKDTVNFYISKKNLDLNLKQEHKAESDPIVAAASILARAAFLESLESLGKDLKIELPKGASAKVLKVGITIHKKLGSEIFKEISKTHFKTYQDILNR